MATATDQSVLDLVVDPTTTQEAAPPAEETQTAEPEKTPANEPEQAEPQPGTPDKALQRMQQELGNVTRKLDELMSKAAEGAPLTAREQQQVQQQARKVEQLRAALEARDPDAAFDPVTHGREVGEAIVEQDAELRRLRDELAAVKAEQQRQSAAVAESYQQTQWEMAQQAYPGVDVEGIFNRCVQEQVEAMGVELSEVQQGSQLWTAIQNAATHVFKQRASTAAKSISARQPQTATRASTKTPVTPGGARTSPQQTPPSGSVHQANEPDMAAILALVTD